MSRYNKSWISEYVDDYFERLEQDDYFDALADDWYQENEAENFKEYQLKQLKEDFQRDLEKIIYEE